MMIPISKTIVNAIPNLDTIMGNDLESSDDEALRGKRVQLTS